MKQPEPSRSTEDARRHSVQPDCSTILFRSAASGLWYENPEAAGDVDCIALHGRLYQWSRGHAELHRLCVARCPDFGKLTFDAQTKVRDAVLRDLSNVKGQP